MGIDPSDIGIDNAAHPQGGHNPSLQLSRAISSERTSLEATDYEEYGGQVWYGRRDAAAEDPGLDGRAASMNENASSTGINSSGGGGVAPGKEMTMPLINLISIFTKI